MDRQPRTRDGYGPGTFTDEEFQPAPDEAARIFRLLADQTPGFLTAGGRVLLGKVRFTGEPYPVIPGPVKSVPIAAALHAMTGVLADEILSLRGHRNPSRRICVNTTHSALWLSTASTAYLDGRPILSFLSDGTLSKVVPNWQNPNQLRPMGLRGTSIYPTRIKGRWYLLHGSLDAAPMLRNLGIDPDGAVEEGAATTPAKAYEHIARTVAAHSPEELEYKNMTAGFCGSICFTPSEWASSSMGKALAGRPLVDVERLEPGCYCAASLPPVGFPAFFGDAAAAAAGSPSPSPSPSRRPLEGVKVLELARIIAAPEIGAVLASYGADVIRVNAPHLPDMSVLQVSLNAGKRTIALDLREEGDRRKMETLLGDADVFIQGFRPGTLKRFGLGEHDVLSVAAKRGKGIVYVAESCYGAEGLYSSRPGWQQVADCASGLAHVMGRSYGLGDGECVLPSLPISDMMCGLVGAVGVMMALRDRAVKGGSYVVRPALVRGNMFALSGEVGLYSPEVVRHCQERFAWSEMRAQHHVLDLLKAVWEGWQRDELMRERYLREGNREFWQSWEKSAFGPGGGMRLSILKPVVRFQTLNLDGHQEIEKETAPGWTSPSVPYCFHDKDEVHFD
ncbi:succinate--hydroxymethylglutarate CoA-transferase [Cladorrhinum samala]|uniref:Succinate--hydroxymethylglutarate CoA-transferase n=1 Tax=Cladorrhinum samala TaxID=585594 RepID=A0AAV9HRM4_9PEZI|nr:succinate--hydroxymethylglutarate CoA-transferase [Cladorrhinum samala]